MSGHPQGNPSKPEKQKEEKRKACRKCKKLNKKTGKQVPSNDSFFKEKRCSSMKWKIP
jgi:hypothetical protein